MSRKNFFLISFFAAVIYTPLAYADGVLGITAISAEKTYAQADGDFAHGFKWVFSVTVPDNEPVLQMKFGDWTNASGTIPAAGNIRFYSAQSSNVSAVGNAVTVAAANAYGSVMNLLPSTNSAFDLSTSTPGRQIQITIEARISAGSVGGSYSANYGILTNPDTIVPVISLLGSSSVTIERGTVYTDAGATASDNIDGTITSGIVLSGAVTVSSVGTYILSYNVSDATGNAATTVTRSVVVQDTIAPTATVGYSTTTPTNANVVATLQPSEPVTVTNNGGATTTTFTQNGSFTFLFADAGNNTGSTTATVGNIDKVAPTVASFSLNGGTNDVAANVASSSVSIVLNSSEPVNWLSIKIEKQSDASVYKLFQSGVLCEDGTTSCSKTWSGDLSAGTLSDGVYRIRVRMRDAVGNETEGYLGATITVDTTAPVLTVTGGTSINVFVGSSYADAGATALDARDGNIINISSFGSVNINIIGAYTITYTATDALGNTATATRTVNVIPPVLVSSITVSGAGGATTVVKNGALLQMSVVVLPANATNKTVTWSVVGQDSNPPFGNGKGTITQEGVLKGTDIGAGGGDIKVKATATDGSGAVGELVVIVVN